MSIINYLYIYILLYYFRSMEQQQFNKLKEEAKGYLQKGAYKFAATKYKQLINKKIKNITPRTYSILHLNLGIALSFQGKNQQALQYINKAIEIDRTYQKAYFRRIQILSELQRYQEALICPELVKNEEIRKLLKQIEVIYTQNMVDLEWNKIEQKLKFALSNNTQSLFDELNNAIFVKHSEDKNLKQNFETGILMRYLQFLQKNQASNNIFQKYFELIYKFLMNKAIKNQINFSILQFWNKVTNLQFMNIKSDSKLNMKLFKLISFCPVLKLAANKLLKFVIKNVIEIYSMKQNLDSILRFLQLNSEILAEKKQQLNVHLQQFRELYFKCIQIFQQKIENTQLSNIDNIQILSNSVLSILNKYNYLKFDHKSIFDLQNLYHSNAVLLYYSGQSKNNNQMYEVPKNQLDRILDKIIDNIDSFPHLFLINKILFQIENIKLIKECQMYKSLETQLVHKIQEHKSNLFYYLILSSVIVKISFPQDKSTIVNLIQLLKFKSLSNRIIQLQLQLISAMCFSNSSTILKLLQQKDTIIQYLNHLSKTNLKKQIRIQSIKFQSRIVFFLNLLIFQQQEQNLKETAQKMGVTVQEVINARRLQGQKNIIQQRANLQKIRNQFKQLFMQKSYNLLEAISEQIKMNLFEIKYTFCKIISSLAKIYINKFYPTSFLQVFIDVFDSCSSEKKKKNIIFIFFSSICKKCNPSIFLYKHRQKIVKILLESLQQSDHQLIIFETLLSLLNLSTLDIKIPIKSITKFLFQQNQYILHSAFEILNNLLLGGTQQYKKLSADQVKLIRLHFKNYNQIIQNNKKIEKPESDYCHPHKIYATMVSLLMVLADYEDLKIIQFEDFEVFVKRCKNLKYPQRGVVFMKGIYYFDGKGILKKNELNKCKQELEYVQKAFPQRYANIRKTINR